MKRAVFIGRYQPFHYGHDWLIRNKLDNGIPVLIMVRDVPPDEKNPYTTAETCAMISAAFKNEDVMVMTIPDIESVNWGRGVGYETNEFKPPNNIKIISATDIRNKMKNNDNSWKDFVPPSVAEWLENYHAK